MPKLETLSRDAGTEKILEAMDRDGACIVEGLASDDFRTRLLGELNPYIEATSMGRDEFSGFGTSRTGALVARSEAAREAVMDPTVLAAARQFLSPWADRILLHLTQIIRITPGQGEQVFHRDRYAWSTKFPFGIEPQFNTIWALTEFTSETGATRVAPGSHRWEDIRRMPEDGEWCQAEMAAGSVLLYSGSVIHSGGHNKSDAPRLGMNLTYCLGWLRTEENQYLSCPPEIAKTLDPELQDLLGYTMGNYALGYFSQPDPDISKGEITDIRPPELLMDRKPSEALGAFAE